MKNKNEEERSVSQTPPKTVFEFVTAIFWRKRFGKIGLGLIIVGIGSFVIWNSFPDDSKNSIIKKITENDNQEEITPKRFIPEEIENKSKGLFIVHVNHTHKEKDAAGGVSRLKEKGYKSGYLWIPDFLSLSQKPFYSVFIGPFNTQSECERATEDYRKIAPDAYGIWVGNENKRIEIRGIGKVKEFKNSRPK